MKEPGKPSDEVERLRALNGYAVVDTDAEPAFDALARLAAHVVGVPIALVSLVDTNRQWFKARYGLDVAETPRRVSLCGHVVESGLPLVVDDTHRDERFADNPLVTDGIKVRFYAGWPLRTPDGHVLGTLCAIGREPRSLSGEQAAMLSLLAGQVIDQLEARRRRLELADSEARLRAVFEAMVEGVVVHDERGAIIAANSAAEDILGLTVDQMRGVSSIDPRWRSVRGDGAPFPGHEHPAMRTLATGAPELDVTMGVHKPTGELTWISINSQPLSKPGASRPYAVAVTFHDISAQRADELARNRLAQQQRLITTGTLAAGVGHEINNPLAYVAANIELALEELRAFGSTTLPGVKSTIEALTDASDGAERIRRIVRGLRALAREESRAVATSVQEAVETAVHMTMHELRHRATVRIEVGDVPDVCADDSRLTQLLVNLLVNAAQAFLQPNPERNLVVIRAQQQPGSRVSISVIDNGPGIEPEVLPRIFDPFFTTKSVGHGTGLGLAICHSIVTSLGGTIQCITDVGRGSTFEVMLPRAHVASTLSASPPATPTASRGSVLVIDDDEAVLRALVRSLASVHHVVGVSDSREAWRRLEAGERFDVIFCDVTMPHITGTQLLRRLREVDVDQAARFVFITGGAVDADASDVALIASTEQLEKPFTTGDVREFARRHVQRDAQRGPGAR